MKPGLKVHHSDVGQLMWIGPPDTLEFALFYDDLEGSWADMIEFNGPIVLHMPEKFKDGSLIDLAASDIKKRNAAIKALKMTIDIAERLDAKYVICHPGGVRLKLRYVDPAPLEDSMRELIDHAPGKLELLLENMPDIYHFRDELYTSCLFKRRDEIIDILKTLDIGLCMDLCHAKLYCNSAGEDYLAYVKALKPLIRHIHISDARGTEDEGVQIGEGEIDFEALLPCLEGLDAAVVPEIFNGHRDRGAAFKIAIDRLESIGFFR
jgi:deoxyribonuclease IV